jgi:MFS family permease
VGSFLGKLDAGGDELGWVVSAGLGGATIAAVIATFFADRLGRRRFLVVTSVIGVLGTIGFALAESPWMLVVAAFVGMVNGMGKDRSAALILEQAVLPSMGAANERTSIIARYTMISTSARARCARRRHPRRDNDLPRANRTARRCSLAVLGIAIRISPSASASVSASPTRMSPESRS